MGTNGLILDENYSGFQLSCVGEKEVIINWASIPKVNYTYCSKLSLRFRTVRNCSVAPMILPVFYVVVFFLKN